MNPVSKKNSSNNSPVEKATAGWFLTRNIMMKVEYVNQEYKNYPGDNILNGGKFYGTMFEAAISF